MGCSGLTSAPPLPRKRSCVRDGAKIATTYSTSYADLGLESGTPHTYTVAALDGAANTSDPSTGASASAAPAPPSSVSYAYDLADRLTGITTASGSTTTFTIDALGRHASQTIGTDPTSSYSYLGTSDTVVAIASGSATTVSAIDALGDRVATSAPGSFGYLLPDLHGNAAGAFNAAGSAISDAFAYDAWGQVVASVTSALPTPWRYQGRMLESAPGTPALYDFSARSYNPALGAFISLDGVHGSAQNPALLNGYLYANANPATLVDPDGHAAYSGCPIQYCGTTAQKAANAAADKQAWGTMQQTVAQTRQFAAAQVGALSAGCPVQYCGTSDQKVANATADRASWTTMQQTVRAKADADAQAPSSATPTSRAGAYTACLDNSANTRSGTSPDAGQQQMLCNAQVARHFDPSPTDESQEWAGLGLIGCIYLCVPALIILGGTAPGAVASRAPALLDAVRTLLSSSGPVAAACNNNKTCFDLVDRVKGLANTSTNIYNSSVGLDGLALGSVDNMPESLEWLKPLFYLAGISAIGSFLFGQILTSGNRPQSSTPSVAPQPVPSPSGSQYPAWRP